jgi:phage-related protein
VHELRIPDENSNWRIFYHLAPQTVVFLGVFEKRTHRTPHQVIATCKRRLALWFGR